MACNLEISMSCVTEAKEEGRSSNSSSLEMLRYRESGACMFDQVKGAIFFLFFLLFFFFFTLQHCSGFGCCILRIILLTLEARTQFSDGSPRHFSALQVSGH